MKIDKQTKSPLAESYRQIWEAIADDLREDILDGSYKPGDRLKEAELAAKYGVSKTPVREALRYLERIGFVEIIPHTMVRVKKLRKKEVENLYSIETALEALAVREAIPNLTKSQLKFLERYASLIEKSYRERNFRAYEEANIAFHSSFWRASENENLFELIDNIRSRLQRYRTATRRYPDKFKGLASDHRKIVAAAKARDIETAEKIVRSHFEENARIILGLLKNGKEL